MYLYAWYSVNGNTLDADEAMALAARAELEGALQAILALEDAVEQSASHALDKHTVLVMLEALRTNILEALREVASGMWPYSGVNDAFRIIKKAEKAPTPQPQEAEARR